MESGAVCTFLLKRDKFSGGRVCYLVAWEAHLFPISAPLGCNTACFPCSTVPQPRYRQGCVESSVAFYLLRHSHLCVCCSASGLVPQTQGSWHQPSQSSSSPVGVIATSDAVLMGKVIFHPENPRAQLHRIVIHQGFLVQSLMVCLFLVECCHSFKHCVEFPRAALAA